MIGISSRKRMGFPLSNRRSERNPRCFEQPCQMGRPIQACPSPARCGVLGLQISALGQPPTSPTEKGAPKKCVLAKTFHGETAERSLQSGLSEPKPTQGRRLPTKLPSAYLLDIVLVYEVINHPTWIKHPRRFGKDPYNDEKRHLNQPEFTFRLFVARPPLGDHLALHNYTSDSLAALRVATLRCCRPLRLLSRSKSDQ